MILAPLADHPHLVPRLARLFYDEWHHLVPEWSLKQAEAAVADRARRQGLPQSLVLIDADGELVGSASLKASDLPGRPELGPWLAALYVLPAECSEHHQRPITIMYKDLRPT